MVGHPLRKYLQSQSVTSKDLKFGDNVHPHPNQPRKVKLSSSQILGVCQKAWFFKIFKMQQNNGLDWWAVIAHPNQENPLESETVTTTNGPDN